ncbi:MAG: adenylosuccinate lyase [Candidatus Geothermarchaeales archaeon]
MEVCDIRMVNRTIHPIEDRYGSVEMREIFERERWLRLMLDVEVELVRALAELGHVPTAAVEEVSAAAERVRLGRVGEIEDDTKRETMAVVLALAEQSGTAGGYVHLGVTSNDILDTVTAMQLSRACDIMDSKIRRLLRVLCDLARGESQTLCLGRTHGRAAIPMVFGFKFAVYASQIGRARQTACVGKMSGAIGTMAEFGSDGPELQRRVMRRLKLRESDISTQVVPRDRLAEFLLAVCLGSSVLETIASEVRNLQRSGIDEVAEPFTSGQVGSTAMPHKRNPVLSEKICGLARYLRGISVGALENVVLEHERDLTNSSFERTALPEACLLFDEQLDSILKVLSNLEVNRERMMRNLEETGSVIMSENVLLKATLKGANRQEAHKRLRNAAMKHAAMNLPFADLLLKDEYIGKFLSEKELSQALKFDAAVGAGPQQIDTVCAFLESRHL